MCISHQFFSLAECLLGLSYPPPLCIWQEFFYKTPLKILLKPAESPLSIPDSGDVIKNRHPSRVVYPPRNQSRVRNIGANTTKRAESGSPPRGVQRKSGAFAPLFYYSSVSSACSSPVIIFCDNNPALERICCSISSAIFGFSFRKVRVFSRPCPKR